MRYLLILVGLLCCPNAVFAQVAAPSARPDTLVTAPAAPDTAAAIHRLFAGQHLHRDLIITGLGAGAFVVAAISSSTGNNSSGHGSSGYGSLGGGGLDFSGADFLLLYAIPATPLILLDYVVYANYSRKREKRVVEEFRAHRLPAQLRRKLKPRYFH